MPLVLVLVQVQVQVLYKGSRGWCPMGWCPMWWKSGGVVDFSGKHHGSFEYVCSEL